jgi:hypothetical protein
MWHHHRLRHPCRGCMSIVLRHLLRWCTTCPLHRHTIAIGHPRHHRGTLPISIRTTALNRATTIAKRG